MYVLTTCLPHLPLCRLSIDSDLLAAERVHSGKVTETGVTNSPANTDLEAEKSTSQSLIPPSSVQNVVVLVVQLLGLTHRHNAMMPLLTRLYGSIGAIPPLLMSVWLLSILDRDSNNFCDGADAVTAVAKIDDTPGFASDGDNQTLEQVKEICSDWIDTQGLRESSDVVAIAETSKFLELYAIKVLMRLNEPTLAENIVTKTTLLPETERSILEETVLDRMGKLTEVTEETPAQETPEPTRTVCWC